MKTNIDRSRWTVKEASGGGPSTNSYASLNVVLSFNFAPCIQLTVRDYDWIKCYLTVPRYPSSILSYNSIAVWHRTDREITIIHNVERYMLCRKQS